MSKRYHKSELMLERARKTIPLGAQTFSKSITQYPYGVSPYFVAKAQGGRLWDVDGNEYIDFINGLAAITLGYNDPDVNDAVQRQVEEGSIFSLSHPLEFKVAEKVVEMVPCAEMVRFGKNGSDATSGAVRIARACTGRDHVAVCGYHGWQDWYIGSTLRNLGVPEATKALTHTFHYNDSGSLQSLLEKSKGKFAAVILEPMNIYDPIPGFLEEVQQLTHEHGALLIFDETITGFRFANGGAQEYFGIVPDLATFGKGLANGYPLSVVTGKEKYMQAMEEIFFSFTFGGETLSLAAALATMTKLQEHPVTKTLYKIGNILGNGVRRLIISHHVEHIFSFQGNPSWSFLLIQDVEPYSQWQIKTLFLQEMFSRGILTLGSHNICYAHTEKDISRLLEVYDEVFPFIRDVVASRDVESALKCDPLQSLFRVR